MLAKLCEYYFYFNPIVLLLDVTELNYQWGDTMRHPINFFKNILADLDEQDKPMFILISEKNKEGILSLDKMLSQGNRRYFNNYQEMLAEAERYLKEYLS